MLEWLPPGTELVRDVSAAAWILAELKPWDVAQGVRLHSFAPSGFASYARIFHPAGSSPAFGGALEQDRGVRWRALGRERGIDLSSDVSFSEVSGVDPEDQDRFDEIQPDDGNLPRGTCAALARILSSHTKDPDACWFCLWEGNGAFWSGSHTPLYEGERDPRRVEELRAEAKAQDDLLEHTPRVEAQDRAYFLFRGPLVAASSFAPDGWYTSPNLWWPDDRAWIVVTEVDGYSTYLGGPESLVADVLGSLEVEAIEVSSDVHMDPGPYRPRWR